ncbi:MAG: GNAT family N-acetyltransferase [Bacteroidetes bacterium]|nr:GNAT family N-acetyltransferase [Bacteroidota bacterium]
MLKGKHIELRALEPSDVDLLFKWENDEKLWYLSNTLAPFSRFQLEQYVLNSGNDIFKDRQLRLMIDHIESGQKETIGSIDLFDFEPHHRRAGVGIMIIESARKKGFAREALEMIIHHCFDVLNMHQLYCNISNTNIASLELFRNSGFEISGQKKEWLMIRNQWEDEYFLQLINR